MHLKVGLFQVQVKKLIKGLSDCINLVDRPEPGVPMERYAFGSRTLDVRYQINANNLYLAETLTKEFRVAQESIKLFVLNSESIEKLPVPASIQPGAYDAISESEKNGWVITLEPVTKALLALEIKTLRVLFFPGNKIEPRNRAEVFRPLLHWLSILKGGLVLHAGAITHGDNALLIAGPGNSGKTTLTQLCLTSGFGFLGDNVIEVQSSNDVYFAYGVYCTFKLRPDAIKVDILDTFSHEKDHQSGKKVYFGANQLGNGFDVNPKKIIGILRLDREGPKKIIIDAKSQVAFNITPNTIGQFPFFEEETMKRTYTLVKMVPTYWAGLLNPQEAYSMVKELF